MEQVGILIIGDKEFPLEKIEVTSTERLRLTAYEALPELKMRHNFMLVRGATREPVRHPSQHEGPNIVTVSLTYS